MAQNSSGTAAQSEVPRRMGQGKSHETTEATSVVTYFLQACPICGRRLRIQVELLGHSVRCRHCRGEFLARAGAEDSNAAMDYRSNMRHRAERMLAAWES